MTTDPTSLPPMPSLVSARVWPHNHTSEFGGPLDVKIGVSSQPALLKGWSPRSKPLFNLYQPMPDESNLTFLHVLFLLHGRKPSIIPPDEIFHKANVWGIKECPVPAVDKDMPDRKQFVSVWKRMKPSHITVYLPGRHTNAMKHPIPLGKWEGTLSTDDKRWALFTFQAVTLAVQHKQVKRHILVPGDAEYDTVAEYKSLISGNDGLG